MEFVMKILLLFTLVTLVLGGRERVKTGEQPTCVRKLDKCQQTVNHKRYRPTKWYCAVEWSNKVLKATVDFKEAQILAYGGAAPRIRAIIQMVNQNADQVLLMNWRGNWGGDPGDAQIAAMKSMCMRVAPPQDFCEARTTSRPCYEPKDRKSCLTSEDSRGFVKGQLCVWCPNGPCTSGSAYKCEPKKWLEQEPTRRHTFEECLRAETGSVDDNLLMEKAIKNCEDDTACRNKLEKDGVDMNTVKNGIIATQSSLAIITDTANAVAGDKLEKHLKKAGSTVTDAVSRGGKIAADIVELTKVAGAVLGVLGPVSEMVLGFLVPSAEQRLLKELTTEVKNQFNRVNQRFDVTLGKLDDLETKMKMEHLTTRHHAAIARIRDATSLMKMLFEAENNTYVVNMMKNYDGQEVRVATRSLFDMLTVGTDIVTIVKGSKYNRQHSYAILLRYYNYMEQGAKFYLLWSIIMEDEFGSENKENLRKTRAEEWQKKLEKAMGAIKEADDKYFVNHFNNDKGLQWKNDLRNTEFMNQYAPEGEDMAAKLHHYLSHRYEWRDWMVIVYKSTAENAITEHYVETTCDNYLRYPSQNGQYNIIVANVDQEKAPIQNIWKSKGRTGMDGSRRHDLHNKNKYKDYQAAYKVAPVLSPYWQWNGCQIYAVRAVISPNKEAKTAGPKSRIIRAKYRLWWQVMGDGWGVREWRHYDTEMILMG